MRLTLGTVSFGMRYGVSGRDDQITREEVRGILDDARDGGILDLDTAQAYGKSEEVLSELITPQEAFRVITKTTPIASETIAEKEIALVLAKFDQFLTRLRRSQIEGIYVHHASDLKKQGAEKLWAALEQLKSSGRVRWIGVSVYAWEEIPEWVIQTGSISWIQAPYSYLDRRLEKHLERIRSRGVRIQVRSIFLQGLLLMERERRPLYFDRWMNRLDEVAERARLSGKSLLEFAMGFVKGSPVPDSVVVGVQRREEWKEILKVWNSVSGFTDPTESCEDLELIEPFRWKIA